ncbi:MAG: hypothetical protein J5723_02025 [Ruminococcus sp.]|nr:hypothetical protein [Ruminococcus sp.]
MPLITSRPAHHVQHYITCVGAHPCCEFTRSIEAFSVRIDDEIRRIKGLPVSRYDHDKNMPYIEYPDERRVYNE